MSIGIWQKQGVVVAPVGADEPGQPNVIYETGSIIIGGGSPVFKMWFGTVNGVCYAESADGLTSWTRYSGNPIAGSGEQFPRIFKNAGTYYLYTNGFSGSIAAYTSTDGVTFTLQNANAITTAGSPWAGAIGQLNVVTIDTGGTWWGFYSGLQTSDNQYVMGAATSTDGIHWTITPGNPAITAYFPSNFCYQTVNGLYYGWSETVVPAIPDYGSLSIPSDISRYYATAPGGPFTAQLSGVSSFYRTTTGEGVGLVIGQVADPSMLSVSGTLYLYYTQNTDGTGSSGYKISCATAPSTTFAQLVTGYEGILDVPITSNTGLALQLVTLASDTFSIGDPNWTQLTATSGWNNPTYTTGSAAGTLATTRATAYYSAISWAANADQWAQVTMLTNANAGSFTGLGLRMSTSGAATGYFMVWGGGALGATGQWYMQKFVANTYTQLATGSIVVNVADVLTGSVVGSTLSLYQNGNLIYVTTDTAITSGAPGIMLYGGTLGSNSAVSAFSAGNLAAQFVTLSITGSTGVAAAIVTYSGTASGMVTANGSGNFTISGLGPGTYTVTPSKAGHAFSPTSATVGSGGANITGVNFTSMTSTGSGSLMLMGCGA